MPTGGGVSNTSKRGKQYKSLNLRHGQAYHGRTRTLQATKTVPGQYFFPFMLLQIHCMGVTFLEHLRLNKNKNDEILRKAATINGVITHAYYTAYGWAIVRKLLSTGYKSYALDITCTLLSRQFWRSVAAARIFTCFKSMCRLVDETALRLQTITSLAVCKELRVSYFHSASWLSLAYPFVSVAPYWQTREPGLSYMPSIMAMCVVCWQYNMEQI